MKSTLRLQTICLLFMGMLSACPSDTDIPLFEHTSLSKIDQELLGVWMNDSSQVEVHRLRFSKANDSTYGVKILHKGRTYAPETDSLIAWTGALEGNNYMIFQPVKEGKPQKSYYLYKVSKDGPKLVTHVVRMVVRGSAAAATQSEYQEEIGKSARIPGTLADEIHWRKLKL